MKYLNNSNYCIFSREVSKMVHKKYIKKNGKVYGPYYYKSKRVGDKVISEYVGENKPREIPRKTLIRGGFALLIIVFFLLVLVSVNSGIFTGKTVSGEGKDSTQDTFTITGNAVNNEILNEPLVNDGEFSQSIRNFKNWVIVTFSMNGEVGEYSYSNTLSQEELDSLIQRDKTLWLEKFN